MLYNEQEILNIRIVPLNHDYENDLADIFQIKQNTDSTKYNDEILEENIKVFKNSGVIPLVLRKRLLYQRC